MSITAMSLEQKVGQLFMVHTHGTIAGEEAQELIGALHIGGIIYYNWSNALSSPEQVRQLSASLQKMAKIPLLIATDQEGGIVARLSSGGFTQFPGNMALAATEDLILAEAAACAMGAEMAACGVNMNLAPVVDVNCEPENPVIGVRSFGDDPQKVTAYARAMIAGFSEAGIVSTLKHFPGHGDTKKNSHEECPTVNKSRKELERMELFPFQALSSQADAIMTAHIRVPALDPNECATLSYPMLTKLLRNELNFKGVVITDSMVMQGVLDDCNGDVDAACLKAFEAGCDIILLGGKDLQIAKSELTLSDISRIVELFQQRVKEGAISMERLDASVERILALKRKISSATPKSFSAPEEVSRHIAMASITALRPGVLDLKGRSVCVIAPKICSGASRFDACFFDPFNFSEKERAVLLEKAQAKDVVIFFSYNAWKNPDQQELIRAIAALKKPCGVIATRDPYDVGVVPAPMLVLATYSTLPVSLEVAWEVLQGHLPAQGQCPAHISPEK